MKRFEKSAPPGGGWGCGILDFRVGKPKKNDIYPKQSAESQKINSLTTISQNYANDSIA
jgi:hypothetical protein